MKYSGTDIRPMYDVDLASARECTHCAHLPLICDTVCSGPTAASAWGSESAHSRSSYWSVRVQREAVAHPCTHAWRHSPTHPPAPVRMRASSECTRSYTSRQVCPPSNRPTRERRPPTLPTRESVAHAPLRQIYRWPRSVITAQQINYCDCDEVLTSISIELGWVGRWVGINPIHLT
jgi:hypothetical protein